MGSDRENNMTSIHTNEIDNFGRKQMQAYKLSDVMVNEVDTLRN